MELRNIQKTSIMLFQEIIKKKEGYVQGEEGPNGRSLMGRSFIGSFEGGLGGLMHRAY